MNKFKRSLERSCLKCQFFWKEDFSKDWSLATQVSCRKPGLAQESVKWSWKLSPGLQKTSSLEKQWSQSRRSYNYWAPTRGPREGTLSSQTGSQGRLEGKPRGRKLSVNGKSLWAKALGEAQSSEENRERIRWGSFCSPRLPGVICGSCGIASS